jgi:hypothetical protein
MEAGGLGLGARGVRFTKCLGGEAMGLQRGNYGTNAE